MSEWQGNERRVSNITLNDVLMEVREVKNDVRHFTKSFDEHAKADKEFQDKVSNDVIWIQRIGFGLVGIWVFVQFLFQIGALDLRSGQGNSNNSNNNGMGVPNPHVGKHNGITREGELVRGASA